MAQTYFNLLISSFGIILGVFVLYKNWRSAINRTFTLFIWIISLWIVSVSILQARPSFIWGIVTISLGFLIGSGFVLFAKIFPEHKKLSKKFLIFLLLPPIIFFFLAPSRLLLKDVVIRKGENPEPVFGSFFPILAIYGVILIIYGIFLLFKKYRESSGIQRLQLKYLFLGLSVFITLTIVSSAILPVLKIYQFSFFSPAFTIVFVAFTTYAIIRHRLMDIRLIIKRSLVVFFSYVFVILFVWGIMIGVGKFIGRSPDPKLTVAGLLSVVIAIGFYSVIKRFLERTANRYFFTSLYNYQATLEDLATKLTAVIEINKVIDLIVDTIIRTMGLDRTGVLLLSPEKNSNRYLIAKVIGFNEQNGISLIRDNFLIQWLQNNKKIIVHEELKWLIEEARDDTEKSKLMRLKTNMAKIEASLCIPLFSKNTLISIIVLGNKVTRDAYTLEDLQLLQTIANQASIAIENARLYQQVQEFNKNLQDKVNEQTRDIKDKNTRLEKLLQIRSEFLDIASHQLRTPVSMIRGVLSMIRDGDLQKLPKEKQTQFIENAWQKGGKLDTIINDILAASELDTQKFQVDATTPTIQVEEVVDQVVKGSQMEAEERGIELKWQPPKSHLPKVQGHANFLEQAFNNLIGNALKYTPSTKMAREARAQRETKGVVEVSINQVKNNVVVKVSDNGIGIPKDEIKKLFDKFVRASNATAMYTDGSGLGLFIVKEIVGGHQGKVWVESELDKGSTFYLSLPVAGG